MEDNNVNVQAMRAQQDILSAYLCRSVLDYIIQSWLPIAVTDESRKEIFLGLNKNAPPIDDSVIEYCLAALDPTTFDAFMAGVKVLLHRVGHSIEAMSEVVGKRASYDNVSKGDELQWPEPEPQSMTRTLELNQLR